MTKRQKTLNYTIYQSFISNEPFYKSLIKDFNNATIILCKYLSPKPKILIITDEYEPSQNRQIIFFNIIKTYELLLKRDSSICRILKNSIILKDDLKIYPILISSIIPIYLFNRY